MPGLGIGIGLTGFGPLSAGASSGVPLASLDAPINASIKSKTPFFYCHHKVVYDYSGNTARYERSSDTAQADFGFDSSGRFDESSLIAWLAGADGKLVTMYDQTGNGKHHQYTNKPVLVSGGAFLEKAATSKSSVNGALSLTGQGCPGIIYNGTNGYGETTTCGATTASGFEMHTMGFHRTRKVNSTKTASDPFSGNSTSEIVASYGTAATNMMFDRTCAGTNLNFCDRNGSGAGGGDQWIYGEIAQGKYAKYQLFIRTLTCNESDAGGPWMRRYEYGVKAAETATSAGNQTADAAMTNGTYRTGRGYGTDTTWANVTLFAFGATTGLTKEERILLHDQLKQIAMSHRAVSWANAHAPLDEVLDFRDANSSTGVLVGRKGKLTLQLNMGTGKTWSFGYSPILGSVGGTIYKGVRSPDIFNNANTFEATTNYFYDVHEFTVGTLVHVERAAIQDYWGMTKTKDANGYGTGTIGLEQGWDHYGNRTMTAVDSALDTNNYSGDYGITDATIQSISQGEIKYGTKTVNAEWMPPQTSGSNFSLRAIYGSISITVGQVVTAANLKAWCNVDPPTPELNYANHQNVGSFLQGAGYYNLVLYDLTPNASYDYSAAQAARETYIKKASCKMYTTTAIGAALAQADSSLAIKTNSVNHAHMDSSYKIRSMQYQSGGANFQGTYCAMYFATKNLTDTQKEYLDVNKYKMYTEGW